MIKNTITAIALITACYSSDNDDSPLGLPKQFSYELDFASPTSSYSPAHDLDGRLKCLKKVLDENNELNKFVSFLEVHTVSSRGFNIQTVQEFFKKFKIRVEHEDIHQLISYYYDNPNYKPDENKFDLKKEYNKEWSKNFGPSSVADYGIQYVDSGEFNESDLDE